MPVYILGSTSLDRIEQELDTLWNALPTDPGLQEELKSNRIDLASLPTGSRRDLLSLKTPKQGVVLEGAVIAVTLAPILTPVAKRALLDIWKDILLPRLRRRFGMKVLHEQKPASKGKTSAKRTRPVSREKAARAKKKRK